MLLVPLLAPAAVGLLAGARPAVAQTCVLRQVAETTLRDDDGFISMPVRIGGRAVSLLVDTGSDGGLMTPAGAALLGLHRDLQHRTVMQGTGGTGRTVPNVLVPDLVIGELALPGGSLPVGELPGMPLVTPPVAGLLGGDVLSRFDVEFDLPHHRLALWLVHANSVLCAPPPAWTGHYDTIPLVRTGNRLTLTATLDGRPISVLVDTGARSRILSTRAAARLGVGADRLGVDPGGITAGVDLHEATYHWHRFARLTIGGERFEHPVLTVAPVAEATDLLLGADWFAGRDVWVSYGVGEIFVRVSGRAPG